MRRIQAYFRTEDEAEGARTALISYRADTLEVSALTDPLGNDRRILLPLIPVAPLNNSGTAAGAVSTGGYGYGAGAPLAAAAVAGNTGDNNEVRGDGRDSVIEDELRHDDDNDAVAEGDLDDLRYVMEIKASDEDYQAVVQALRNKNAYVEVFD